ncbi:hypothetical protein [Psychrosphaera aestuarii]|uniref:hypothetical protein n=1 Tax=Psychrosphaera aestuarii TaxID=1266052 RepID=UPI001B336F96|nr:hypothetical protein [Psychrosphaera aestuarii]
MKAFKILLITSITLLVINPPAFANDNEELQTVIQTEANTVHDDAQKGAVEPALQATFIPDLLGVWNLIIGRTQEIRDEAFEQTKTLQHGMNHHRDVLFDLTMNVRNDLRTSITSESERLVSQLNEGYADLDNRIKDETNKVTSDVISAKDAIQKDLTSLTAQIQTLSEQGIGLGVLTAEDLTAMITEIKHNRELYQKEIRAFESEKERFLDDFVDFISSLLEVTKKGFDLGLMGTADIEKIANINITEINLVLSHLPNDVLYPLYRVLDRELRYWTEMNNSISESIDIVASPLRNMNPFINNLSISISSDSVRSLSPFHKQMEFCDDHILNNFDNLSQALKIIEYYNTISKVLASLLIEDVLKSLDTTVFEYSIVKSFKFPQISKPGVWMMIKLLDTAPKITGEIASKLKPLLNSCATNDHIRSSQKAQLDILTQICGSMRSCSIQN